MIGYKKEAESLRNKDEQRLSNLWKSVKKKIVEYFKSNDPQRQIAKDLQIS